MTDNGNPLLQDWQTPYQLPPFQQIQPEHFAPAFAVLFEKHLAEIDALAENQAAPTFDNTVAAFDATGATLDRVRLTFENLCASESPATLQAVEREMAPLLAAHDSKVAMHAGFFARLDAVHQQAAVLDLSEEQQRLLQRMHTDFVRTGATLQGSDRERFTAIATRLADLQTQFAQNILADESSYQLPLTSEADLAGLPDFLRQSARSAAKERGVEGYVITLSRSLVQPFLTWSMRRDLRETAWRAWTSRGENPARDNRPIAREILILRQEQARLLGYENFADYALADRMAGSASEVHALLSQVWEPAKASVEQERQALAAQAAALGEPTDVEPWDWYYLAEKVRVTRYALDDAQVKPYFSLDAMLAAMFDCAERLFQLQFVEKTGVPLYHPDVRLWEVRRGAELVGLFLGDNYARPNKQGGAWMHVYRKQRRHGGKVTPIVVNNNNFARTDNGPTLLSFDDVRTLFHEFGHGLHGLLSDVNYGRLSGTNVPQDYVELPSQLMENWATVPEVLAKHARHVTTGEPIPAALIERIRASQTFNQGFQTVAYTSSALIDMALHLQSDPAGIDIARFEIAERERLGVPREVGMRHRLPHFGHIFSGGYYAAGYYVYMWAEVLEADAFDAFEEAGNAFDPALADKLHRYVYSAGDSRKQGSAFRAFRGRDPRAEPMLRKRGLLRSEGIEDWEMTKPSRTSLFAAATLWDAASVAANLVSAPELVKVSDPQGRTALHRACAVKPGSSTQLAEPNGIRTVTTLLEAGAELEREVPMDEDEGDFRATPLWYAVARGENLPLVRFLLQRGANASYSLWAAVWRDDDLLCRTLLKSKPELDLRAHGETPIFYAARLKRLKTLDLLIKAGADPSIADSAGRDAVGIARARRLPKEMIDRLEHLKKGMQANRA